MDHGITLSVCVSTLHCTRATPYLATTSPGSTQSSVSPSPAGIMPQSRQDQMMRDDRCLSRLVLVWSIRDLIFATGNQFRSIFNAGNHLDCPVHLPVAATACRRLPPSSFPRKMQKGINKENRIKMSGLMRPRPDTNVTRVPPNRTGMCSCPQQWVLLVGGGDGRTPSPPRPGSLIMSPPHRPPKNRGGPTVFTIGNISFQYAWKY